MSRGWRFDHAVLVPVVIALVCRLRMAFSLHRLGRLGVLSGLAARQLGLLAVNQVAVNSMESTLWS